MMMMKMMKTSQNKQNNLPFTVIIFQIWRGTLSMLCFNQYTSYLISVKPNLSWSTKQPALLHICLWFQISQMPGLLFYKENQPSFKNFHCNKWSRIHGSKIYISDGLWTPIKSIVFSLQVCQILAKSMAKKLPLTHLITHSLLRLTFQMSSVVPTSTIDFASVLPTYTIILTGVQCCTLPRWLTSLDIPPPMVLRYHQLWCQRLT